GTFGSNAVSAAGSGTYFFFILPFIEQNNLYKQANGSAANVANVVLPIFLCPSDPSRVSNDIQRYGYASTSYCANLLVFKPQGPGDIVRAMPDGSSNTVLLAE